MNDRQQGLLIVLVCSMLITHAGVKVDSELGEKMDTNELSLTPGSAGVNESLLKSAGLCVCVCRSAGI